MNNMDILQKIEDAARLLREAARQLEEDGILELDFEIRIKARRLSSMVILNTNPEETRVRDKNETY